MHTSAKTLLGIINDILDVSKIESGKFELDITEVNLHDSFEKTALTFTTKFEEKRVHFRLSVDDAIAKCLRFDLLRMQQIISNLLSNAIKFTPEMGSIELYVKVLEANEESQTLRIGVKDSGIGIAKEHQKRIFEAFSQAAISTTRMYGGTGLGLTISARLVSLMGSHLQVESQEGAGSDFYFDLLLKRCR